MRGVWILVAAIEFPVAGYCLGLFSQTHDLAWLAISVLFASVGLTAYISGL